MGLAATALLLAGCAGVAPRTGGTYVDAELQRREAQIARGMAGARDAGAERDLAALACRIAATRCGSLRLYVVDRRGAQARAWPNGMLLVHGALFEALDDESELAFALAHEIAHLELGHFDLRRSDALELEADAWALDRLRALRYRGDAGFTLLRRLAQRRGATPPAVHARLRALAPSS